MGSCRSNSNCSSSNSSISSNSCSSSSSDSDSSSNCSDSDSGIFDLCLHCAPLFHAVDTKATMVAIAVR